MIKYFILLIVAAVFFIACEKINEEPINLKGTIKGNLSLIDEYGNDFYNYSNTSIELIGSDPLLTVYPNDQGEYEITDIPTGTYDLFAKKPGFGELTHNGISIVGGNEPVYRNINVYQKSTVEIEDLSYTIVDNQILLSGIVHHGYIQDGFMLHNPLIYYYISTDSTPSYENYTFEWTFTFEGESGSSFNRPLYYYNDLFISGDIIYVVAYGSGWFYNYNFDVDSGKYYNNCFGEASNIIQIEIP